MKKIFSILAIFLLVLAFTGCSAMRASQQPDKKDLSVLDSGVSRDLVRAELGIPVSIGEDTTGNYDIFSFNEGYSKGNKSVRVIAHGAVSLLTCGLWEFIGLPIETSATGKEQKLKVYYDANNKVSKVINLAPKKEKKGKSKTETEKEE
ncbi:MAG: hypothetical protein KAV41_02615 [Candidatus Pacebacteria bacterium]|nr:hypothetical protein [Candidatus Paceibacterota bacterium]